MAMRVGTGTQRARLAGRGLGSKIRVESNERVGPVDQSTPAQFDLNLRPAVAALGLVVRDGAGWPVQARPESPPGLAELRPECLTAISDCTIA